MHPIDALTVQEWQVVINLVATVLGATTSAMIAFSIFLTWKRTGYRLLQALMIFFAVLSFNQFVSTITNVAFLFNAHKILVLPLFEVRQVIFTSALLYLFYSLWRRNNKVRKLMEAAEAHHETIANHDTHQS